MRELFMDAAYAIAISSPKDECHARAVELAEQIQSERIPLVTTRAVVLEIGNALSKQHLRQSAVALVGGLQSDSNVEIVAVTEDLFAQVSIVPGQA